MEKRSLVRILAAVGFAATLPSAVALAQSVRLPTGPLTPSVFAEWTQFFDSGESIAQARVRLLHSIKGSNRGQVNKWLNQWLRGLRDDEDFEDDSDGSGPGKHPVSVTAASGQPAPGTDKGTVTIAGEDFDLTAPGGPLVPQWTLPPDGRPDQPATVEVDTPITANPEPATLLLLAPGFLTAFVVRRRRRQSVDH
jgi:hypothetical protein